MTIKVNYKRSEQDITVQFINDGYVTCNHANGSYQLTGVGTVDVCSTWCCDKCPAQLIYGEWL